MKTFNKLLIFVLCLMLFTPRAFADVNYQVYRAGGPTPCFGCGQALNSGTTTNINYNWGSGVVMNSGLADGVEIHFTGYITVPGSGSQTITFYDYSDDGFILNVNGSRVISNWQEQGPANWNGRGSITLQGGQTYAFDVWYYENGGGAAVELFWNQSGSITLIPNSDYVTTMPNPKAFGDGGAPLPSASVSTQELVKISQTVSLTNNSVYIQNYGNNTNVTITQTGDYNVIRGINGAQSAVINGNYNTMNVQQGSTTVPGYNNLLEASILGSYNTLSVNQQTSSNYTEANINGSTNSANVTQSGTAGKSAFIEVSGSNNSITTTQQGNANHFLELNIPTNGNTVSVTQAGAAQKLFSLTINSANVGVTVVQDNATTADSASMSITCTSGPCTGYSYVKH